MSSKYGSKFVRPCVSIGVPTRNRRMFLERALESILAQTYPHIEVVVSDNNSTDGTVEVLKQQTDPRVRVVFQPYDVGMSANFNACLNHARGELFLMLSDDDFLKPTAVEELSRPFREGSRNTSPSDVGVVWCPCTNVDATGRPMWVTRAGPAVERSLDMVLGIYDGTRGPQFCSVMLRTRDAQLVGYNDEVFGVLSDSVPWMSTALKYPKAVCVKHSLVCYTIHSASGSSTARCAEWQRYVNRQMDALQQVLQGRGDSEGVIKLESRRKKLLANITITVLMRRMGRPGWIAECVKESWRSRAFMLTPFVMRRLVVDGWKLLRIGRSQECAARKSL